MTEAAGGDPDGLSLFAANPKRKAMHMNTNRRSHPGETPDLVRGQAGLPIDGGTDGHANGQDANGHSSGPMITGAIGPDKPADPFDLDSLRLSQDFASVVGVKKLITTVPVRKPSKEWYVRTHANPEYRLPTAVLELKDGDREIYLVAPNLRPELASEPTVSPRELVTAINRQGVLFLWPIRLPGPDGKIDDWNRSALEAADKGRSEWVRVKANTSLGAYEIDASSSGGEPTWPDIEFLEIIKIAFRDKVIADWSHPVLRRLRGEA
jgi:hypothetical protein